MKQRKKGKRAGAKKKTEEPNEIEFLRSETIVSEILGDTYAKETPWMIASKDVEDRQTIPKTRRRVINIL